MVHWGRESSFWDKKIEKPVFPCNGRTTGERFKFDAITMSARN